jgi:hypothetical protein
MLFLAERLAGLVVAVSAVSGAESARSGTLRPGPRRLFATIGAGTGRSPVQIFSTLANSSNFYSRPAKKRSLQTLALSSAPPGNGRNACGHASRYRVVILISVSSVLLTSGPAKL